MQFLQKELSSPSRKRAEESSDADLSAADRFVSFCGRGAIRV
jgi:hypothetical protein